MQTSRAALVMGILLLVGRVAAAEPSLELEMQLAGRTGTGTPLGSCGSGLIGVPLGQRTVLMTGFELSGYGNDQSRGWAVGVPLHLKVYIRAPAERRLVPVLRLGAGYSRTSDTFTAAAWSGEPYSASLTTHNLQAAASLGVVYFITSQLGLGMDAGIVYTHRLGSSGESSGLGVLGTSKDPWTLAARWGASLVFRI
jgi:hypothetical protein